MTNATALRPGRATVRWGRRVGVALVALAAAAVSLHVAFEWSASRRADAALAHIRLGSPCDELVTVVEEYANPDSAMAEARRACAHGGSVTLNFSRGTSLNYLFSVEVSPDGRITSVSSVGAW
jgi:hypothetical protein